MKVEILPSALKDLADGFSFYQNQEHGLGEYFVDTIVVRAILDCRRNPLWIKFSFLIQKPISKVPDQVPSPKWHQKVISERLNKIQRGEAKFLTLDQVKARLSANRK